MLDQNVVFKLKEKYSYLHLLLFARSVERARSNGDLFDIVDTVPKNFPIVWNEKEYRWQSVSDLYLIKELHELQ
jgi:hypothetical protein